ncbi:hypothetical protein HanPI659440_Chr05g0184821 [Helianthus annuus]|nr:hypothetical protein HanPI659440_Chr05g0184821 [Helianthus annuus]
MMVEVSLLWVTVGMVVDRRVSRDCYSTGRVNSGRRLVDGGGSGDCWSEKGGWMVLMSSVVEWFLMGQKTGRQGLNNQIGEEDMD